MTVTKLTNNEMHGILKFDKISQILSSSIAYTQARCVGRRALTTQCRNCVATIFSGHIRTSWKAINEIVNGLYIHNETKIMMKMKV